MNKEIPMAGKRAKRLVTVAIAVTIAFSGDAAYAAADDTNTQLAELYQLQAAFHRAASIHDPVNGDSTAAIDQRIRAMLSLWIENGFLALAVGGARDGYYIGKGDPADASTCPAPSANPANRGTLCTFFKYVAGSFQPANKFVSLSPAYLTQFDIHGHMATMYFECHYFNVALDPLTSRPLWTQANHAVLNGGARKVEGRWLFAHANAPAAGVPIP